MQQTGGGKGDTGRWSRGRPVTALGAILIALFSAMGYYRYSHTWTPLQRVYLKTYIWTQLDGIVQTGGWYTLLMVVTKQGSRLALDEEVQPITNQEGMTTFKMKDTTGKPGTVTLEWQRGPYYNLKLHAFLAHWIYRDQRLIDLAKPPLLVGLGVLIVALIGAISLETARQRCHPQGRRLKGPELTLPRVFNRRIHGDGMGLVQEQKPRVRPSVDRAVQLQLDLRPTEPASPPEVVRSPEALPTPPDLEAAEPRQNRDPVLRPKPGRQPRPFFE